MKPNTPKGKEPLKDKLYIDDLFNLKEVDLYDLHDRLWYELFTPLKPLTKDQKIFIRRQLNIVGAEIKIDAETEGNKCSEVIIVQDDTTFEPDELGPNRLDVIYVETAEPLPLMSNKKRTHTTARSAKLNGNHPSIVKESLIDHDNDDEDLLGDVKGAVIQTGKTKVAHYQKSNGEKPKSVKLSKVKDPNKITATSIYEELCKLANKFGDSPDKISKAKPEWPRKCITDALWKWRKTK